MSSILHFIMHKILRWIGCDIGFIASVSRFTRIIEFFIFLGTVFYALKLLNKNKQGKFKIEDYHRKGIRCIGYDPEIYQYPDGSCKLQLKYDLNGRQINGCSDSRLKLGKKYLETITAKQEIGILVNPEDISTFMPYPSSKANEIGKKLSIIMAFLAIFFSIGLFFAF